MIDEIVVPLDGSDFANRALPVAAALSSALGTRLRIMGIASDDSEFALTHLAVHDAVDREGLHGVDVDLLVDPHLEDRLLATGAAEGTILCLATHDAPDPAARALRAVGSRVVERSERPIVAVGRRACVDSPGTDVVVAIDGVTDPEPLLAVAATWATQLKSRIRIVTMYEPVLADLDHPSRYTRDHGPVGDPDDYVKSVRDQVADFPFGVDAVAIADPISVAAGLEDHLADFPARVLVMGGRHPRPLRPSGGIARHLLREVTVPVVVVNHPA